MRVVPGLGCGLRAQVGLGCGVWAEIRPWAGMGCGPGAAGQDCRLGWSESGLGPACMGCGLRAVGLGSGWSWLSLNLGWGLGAGLSWVVDLMGGSGLDLRGATLCANRMLASLVGVRQRDQAGGGSGGEGTAYLWLSQQWLHQCARLARSQIPPQVSGMLLEAPPRELRLRIGPVPV